MSDGKFVVKCAWPHKDLWQNSRAHWSKRAKATKAARNEAGIVGREVALNSIAGADWYEVRADFYPSKHSRADEQNLEATIKAHIDGLADCLKVDDRRFKVLPKTVHPRSGDVGFVTFTVGVLIDV